MKAAFDETMAIAVKRQHEPQRIVGDLLSAEINEKQARSIKYQLTIAKLPLAKDIADFLFDGTPINQTLVNDLAGGGFIAQQRKAGLVGGTGTGKTGHRHRENLHPIRCPWLLLSALGVVAGDQSRMAGKRSIRFRAVLRKLVAA
jgi:hypothetical protein